MRLLRLEMKRVLKTRSTMILLFLALLLSFLMAWLPVTFCQNSYMDENGNLYICFESAAYAYRARKTDHIDRILVLKASARKN